MPIRFYEHLRNLSSSKDRQKLFDDAKYTLVFDDATSVGWTLHYLDSGTKSSILLESGYKCFSLIKTAIDFNWIMQCVGSEHHSIILNNAKEIMPALATSCGCIGLILCYFNNEDFETVLSILREPIAQFIKTKDDYFYAERNFDAKQREYFRAYINNTLGVPNEETSNQVPNESIVAPASNNSFAMNISQIEGAMQTEQNNNLVVTEKPIKKYPLEYYKSPVFNPAFFEPNSVSIKVLDEGDNNTATLKDEQVEYEESCCCSII